MVYFSRSAFAARAAAEDGRDSCCWTPGCGVFERDLVAECARDPVDEGTDGGFP